MSQRITPEDPFLPPPNVEVVTDLTAMPTHPAASRGIQGLPLLKKISPDVVYVPKLSREEVNLSEEPTLEIPRTFNAYYDVTRQPVDDGRAAVSGLRHVLHQNHTSRELPIVYRARHRRN
jgi:hypothetical protein